MAVHRLAPLGAPVDATVAVPGSKSIANRALVCAALADGVSTLHGVPDGDDTRAMVRALGALGLSVEIDAAADDDGPGAALGDRVTVEGGRRHWRRGPTQIDAGLAGTTSRFMTAAAALVTGPTVIDGQAPLRRRPMGPLHDALAQLGASVRPLGAAGHLPVEIRGPLGAAVEEIELPGDVSSQFLSALMLVAPLRPGGVRIHLRSRLVSRPYVRMTAAVMAAFGIDGVEIGDRIVSVQAGEYVPAEFVVEPDASSASYPLAVAAVCGGRVTVPGLTAASIQGDAEFAELLGRMGCAVHRDARGTTVTGRGRLQGISVDMRDVSDLVPTMAVVAAFASSRTEIHGVGFIRAKESDRIGTLCSELRKAGVAAEERVDGLVVEPGAPHSAVLSTHHDHRLAMAFAVLGSAASGIAVEQPDVVTKSWPGFWETWEALR